jgi:hypothetical protein
VQANMKATLIKSIFVLLGSILLGYLSIFLSVYTSPMDLGQLMFVLLIFLPLIAIVTGVVSEITLKNVMFTIGICLLSFGLIILTKYNRNGLIWIALYICLGIIGHYISYLIRYVLRKLKKT